MLEEVDLTKSLDKKKEYKKQKRPWLWRFWQVARPRR